MAAGPGKYDDVLTLALRRVLAREREICGGVLMVVGMPGHETGGFAVQLTEAATRALPNILRGIADQIEADLASGAVEFPEQTGTLQ